MKTFGLPLTCNTKIRKFHDISKTGNHSLIEAPSQGLAPLPTEDPESTRGNKNAHQHCVALHLIMRFNLTVTLL